MEGIVSYLSENAEEDDVVAITYGDMPLKFYTDLRVVGGLTGEGLSPAKNALDYPDTLMRTGSHRMNIGIVQPLVIRR